MNLTKLFNFKFLKQNLKKSKGLLVLFLSLVPAFTFLVIMLSGNEIVQEPIDQIELSVINILGLFIVPIVLSISLFGYAFKRKSIDFINSMPINRKTIFLTNTLAGIVLIILMQLINMLGLFIVKAINTNIILFSGMIVDMFVYFTVSYIFMFVATNIGMTLAGNMPTQVVLTMLIIFFVPFTVGAINRTFYNNSIDYNLFENGKEIGYIDAKTPIEETMPYRIIRIGFTNSLDEIYNQRSINKMLFLSVLYIGIGLYLFRKRKFENAQESFENQYVHFFTKALTIFPMIMILSIFHYLESEIELILFCVAFIVVYYFIYDLITSKKIKLKASIINLVVTLVVLNGICYGIVEFSEEKEFGKINKEDIKGIAINLNSTYREGFNNSEILDYYMEDKDLINYVYYTSNLEAEDKIHRYITTDPYSIARIKLKNGKTYDMNLVIKTNRFPKQEVINKLIEKLEKDEKYVELYKKQYKAEGTIISYNSKVPDDENDFLVTALDKYIDSCTFRELVELKTGSISKYSYSNHKLTEYKVKENISQEFFDRIVKISNEEAIEALKYEDYDIYNYSIMSSKKDSIKASSNEKEIAEIIDIISKANEIKLDRDKEHFIVEMHVYYDLEDRNIGVNSKVIRFYTDDSKILEIFNRPEDEESYYYKASGKNYYDTDIDFNSDLYTSSVEQPLEEESAEELNVISNDIVSNEIINTQNQ
ncbi:MAG: hypothetical protein HFJ46_01930 [Clostridia bacterium]|nr:hypothetical protein [Clostridia bacterium]